MLPEKQWITLISKIFQSDITSKFDVILKVKWPYLLLFIAENYIVRNQFNNYSIYTYINWVETVYSMWFIKCKLPLPSLYAWVKKWVAIYWIKS